MKKKERITFIQIALLLIFAGMVLIPVFVISNRKSLDNSTPTVKKINPEHNTSTDSSISKVNSKKDSITNKKRQMEFLDRGLIAQQVKDGVFLSWRSLGTDSDKISFNVLRNGKQINIGVIDGATNFIDTGGNVKDSYSIQVMDSRKVIETVGAGDVWPLRAAKVKRKPSRAFKELLLSPPQHKGFEYIPGDMSVGDLDGDGRYELIFEWEGQEPFIEAIDLDGKSLWRIFCGPNVRAHKTGFLVYDFDGDGRAEVACKTGPGTIDGKGKYLSKGPAAKDDDQMIVDKPGYHLIEDHAYITVFDGLTGVELDTVRYEPALGERSKMKENWGDNRGYRAASIKAAVLCTKENGPLMVFTRGIYTRIAMGAFKWDGQKIQKVWNFDTKDNPQYEGYRGMGNHSVAVGDVDGDGSDELIYGACAIDHDGTGLYTTGMGHGDSHALADHDPDHPGLEFYQGHENSKYGISMRAAGTGKVIWEIRSKSDVGRAWAADVCPDTRGSEATSSATKSFDCKGKEVSRNYNPYSQPIYFDGDVQRELRNGVSVDDPLGKHGRIITSWYYGAKTIHSTKNDANLVADILGDWREEIIFRRNDNKAFLIFSSWFPTDHKSYTLMHDPTYRMNVVVQHIGYNQPAHVGFYFADGSPPAQIYTVKAK